MNKYNLPVVKPLVVRLKSSTLFALRASSVGLFGCQGLQEWKKHLTDRFKSQSGPSTATTFHNCDKLPDSLRNWLTRQRTPSLKHTPEI